MFKGKPLIAAPRPFWRHPSLPWGWYSLAHDRFGQATTLKADGYHRPGDGYQQDYVWCPTAPTLNEGRINGR